MTKAPTDTWKPSGLPSTLQEFIDSAPALELSQSVVTFAWSWTQLAPNLDEDDRQTILTAILALIIAQSRGSTGLDFRQGHTGALETILATLIDEEEVAAFPTKFLTLVDDPRTGALVGKAGTYRPLILSDGWLSQQRLRHYEESLGQSIRQRLARPALPLDEDIWERWIKNFQARAPFALTEEQLHAVRNALTCSISVISGGPGTGKTSIIRAIVDALCDMGLSMEEIALAAPTGKAAVRMKTSLGMADADAQPLHRLLGWSQAKRNFRHDENHPLMERVIIIDEASMIDVVLMNRLMRALRSDARLVILGDAHQLPSVDAGAVLRDLVEMDPNITTTLTTSLRTSSEKGAEKINKLADSVLSGDIKPQLFTRIRNIAEADQAGVYFLSTAKADDTAKLIDELYKYLYEPLPEALIRIENRQVVTGDRPKIEALFRHHQRTQILSATRVFRLGTDALNQACQRRLARSSAARGHWLAGQPVMVSQNDYERGLFNADAGVIIGVEEDGEPGLRAIFMVDGEYRAFHPRTLQGQLEPGWATTVHRSQGSEYDDVVFFLAEKEQQIWTREIIYTAVTRARRRVILIGDFEMLTAGCKARLFRQSRLL